MTLQRDRAARLKAKLEQKLPTLADVERAVVEQRLGYLEQHLGATAKSLGISRQTLWRKLQEYKLVDSYKRVATLTIPRG